jgi:lipopolysaccharide biosynthesis glycosyltransferase
MINVCISCDDNYAKYAGVVIASILLNAQEDDDLNFYILDGGISDKAKIKIERLKQIRDFNICYVQIDPSQFDV